MHILTQYLWPDDAPTGVYAEQVADGLAAQGAAVRLVAGSGSYRPGHRQPPLTPVVRLEHRPGRRDSLLSTALEYLAVQRAFRRYVEDQVERGDLVVVTSAPPTTISLHRQVHQCGALGIYWLQDFYPQLVRGIWDPPGVVTRRLGAAWGEALASWDHVVKSAANLGYSGANARVIRNWNTIEPGAPRPAQPYTALYSGNLGYGHDLGAFLRMCAELRDQGYQITVRGDGPGMRRLPGWIDARAPLADPRDLIASYWGAELHLVAGDPDMPEAIFPSKLWNSLAAGRPVRASGFAGPMAAELEVALAADFRQHRGQWVDFLLSLLTRDGEGGR